MPVWPTCFWICWPMPAALPIRLPAASTPMSAMVTPPSARAAMAASAARSTVSWSGCLPKRVMWIPRIQTSSAMGGLLRGEPEADRLGAGAVDADRERGQRHLHAQLHVVGGGLDAHDVASHAGAVAVDGGGHDRHRDPRRRHTHDRERPHLALGGNRHGAEP